MPKQTSPLPVLFMIQFLDSGGTELHFEDLISRIDRKKITPHVVYFQPGVVSRRLEAMPGLAIQRMPIRRAYDLSGWRTVVRLRQYIQHHQIAAVVTYHFSADFIGTLAARAAGVHTVLSSRRDTGFTRSSRQIWLGRQLKRWVTRYIAVSEAVRQSITDQEGVALDKIQTIYNGIDLAALDTKQWDLPAERAGLGIAPDQTVIGCVANFNPVKNHVRLIEAFGRLCQRQPQLSLRLLLAGDGPEHENISASIAARDLQTKVLLVGRSQAVERELQLADIVVLPSLTEGFSNTILQAMAYRKPVVAGRVGGNPEAIEEEKTGLLIDPLSIDSMTDALERLVLDSALRTQMGEAGRERVQRLFTLDKMIETTQQAIFDSLPR